MICPRNKRKSGETFDIASKIWWKNVNTCCKSKIELEVFSIIKFDMFLGDTRASRCRFATTTTTTKIKTPAAATEKNYLLFVFDGWWNCFTTLVNLNGAHTHTEREKRKGEKKRESERKKIHRPEKKINVFIEFQILRWMVANMIFRSNRKWFCLFCCREQKISIDICLHIYNMRFCERMPKVI